MWMSVEYSSDYYCVSVSDENTHTHTHMHACTCIHAYAYTRTRKYTIGTDRLLSEPPCVRQGVPQVPNGE